jgi:hypothetical protein
VPSADGRLAMPQSAQQQQHRTHDSSSNCFFCSGGAGRLKLFLRPVHPQQVLSPQCRGLLCVSLPHLCAETVLVEFANKHSCRVH